MASKTPVPVLNCPLGVPVVSIHEPTTVLPLNKVFKSIVLPIELHNVDDKSSAPAKGIWFQTTGVPIEIDKQGSA